MLRTIRLLEDERDVLQKQVDDLKRVHLRQRESFLNLKKHLETELLQAQQSETEMLEKLKNSNHRCAVWKSRCSWLGTVLLRAMRRLRKLQTWDVSVGEIQDLWDILWGLEKQGGVGKIGTWREGGEVGERGGRRWEEGRGRWEEEEGRWGRGGEDPGRARVR